MKKLLTIVLALIISFSLFACSLDISGSETDITTVFDEVITDESLIKNICDALNSIGINDSEISSVTKTEDWVSGERYNIIYKGVGLTIYTDMNAAVYSINLGNDTQIYLQGYEPYHISDYMMDSETKTYLQTDAMNKVTSNLNFPSTADFPWLDWSYGRDHNLYYVSSSVKAQNAFGVESDIPFSLVYHIENDLSTLVYFSIDGAVVTNNLESYPAPERQKVSNDSSMNTENTSEGITLIDGQLGEYGKEVTLDGEVYINYYVPQGTYTVKNNVKLCVVYVAKDEYYVNDEGYMENDIVEMITLSSPDQTITITVGEGEHIELTQNGSVTLIPQE